LVLSSALLLGAAGGCSATLGFLADTNVPLRTQKQGRMTWGECLRWMQRRNTLDLKPEPGGEGMEFAGKVVLYLPGLVVDTFILPFAVVVDVTFGLIYRRWEFPLIKRFFCFYPAYFGSRKRQAYGVAPQAFQRRFR
jgi:hypothetical protein